MPEASFYILSTQSLHERLLFTCKLIEKAYRFQQFCYVISDSEKISQQLDNLLWSFRPGSFIPHQTFFGEPPDFESTVLIGTQPAPKNWQKVIINLSSTIPNNFDTTERVLEIIDANEQTKLAGRQRYKLYDQAGFDIKTYTI